MNAPLCPICCEPVTGHDPGPETALDHHPAHYICVSILIANQEGRNEARRERGEQTWPSKIVI